MSSGVYADVRVCFVWVSTGLTVVARGGIRGCRVYVHGNRGRCRGNESWFTWMSVGLGADVCLDASMGMSVGAETVSLQDVRWVSTGASAGVSVDVCAVGSTSVSAVFPRAFP